MSDAAWWAEGARILQFNWSREELEHLDVEQLVDVSRSVNANAVVVNGGGIYAWYPTQIRYHYVDPAGRENDPLGRCVEACKAAGIRVVPRVDFSRNADGAFDEHPDWFARDAAGTVHTFQATYSTCPTSPYRNVAYAEPVLREIAGRYDIDGFHLNAGGFRDYCYCPYCQSAFRDEFGRSIPETPDWTDLVWLRFVEWRTRAVAANVDFLYGVIRSLGKDQMFTGELMGPGRSAQLSAMSPRALSGSFSTLLTTTGEAVPRPSSDRSRWWVGMSAKCVRGFRPDTEPLMNLKASLREDGWPRVAVEPATYRFQMWQALANGAGLKLPVLGSLDPHDGLSLPAIAAGFAAARHRTGAGRPVADVVLVWPLATALGYGADDVEHRVWEHFYGAYESLVRSHVPFVVMDEEGLAEQDLGRFQAIILPNAAVLSGAQRAAIAAFVAEGGGLVASYESGRYAADDPRRPGNYLDTVLGVRRGFGPPIGCSAGYGRIDPKHPSVALQGVEFVPQRGPLVECTVDAGTTPTVLLAKSRDMGGSSERYQPPLHTDHVLATAASFGAGRVVYFADAIHQLYWTAPHEATGTVLANALRWVSAEPGTYRTNARPSVEITLERAGADLAVHFVNGTGIGPDGDTVAPVDDVEIVINRRRLPFDVGADGVRAQSLSGTEVSVSGDASEIRLRLGRLMEFETVRIGGLAPTRT